MWIQSAQLWLLNYPVQVFQLPAGNSKWGKMPKQAAEVRSVLLSDPVQRSFQQEDTSFIFPQAVDQAFTNRFGRENHPFLGHWKNFQWWTLRIMASFASVISYKIHWKQSRTIRLEICWLECIFCNLYPKMSAWLGGLISLVINMQNQGTDWFALHTYTNTMFRAGSA